MKKPALPVRYYEIDFLKGFSALIVILIHVLDKYRSVEYVHVLWILAHFAVATFVIASGFLQQYKPLVIDTVKNLFGWFWKRLSRLVGPYYWYVLIHGALILLLPTMFTRVDIKFTPRFLTDTVFLLGGFSQNWIPRLFVLMTILYILYEVIRQKAMKKETAILLPIILSFGLSSIFLFHPFSLSSTVVKYIQTVTWIGLFLYGMLLFQNLKNPKFIKLSFIISGLTTGGMYLLLYVLGEPTSIFAHEYPPTLYFISYGIFWSLGLYLLASQILRIQAIADYFKSIFSFLSKHSYTIFFAHIIVMDLIKKPTGFWLTDYVIIAPVTVLAVYCIEQTGVLIKKQWIQ